MSKSTSSTMPVTEVQWIGASCGRHSSYTFYRGFRLIVDGVVKNFCLGEFYFVRNSINQPICIAELQLVWYDASTDSQLASARLYFRPEDTPVGRLANHGQDELLYADQKIVIKCHDMAVWQYSGVLWNSGMVPLCESDFVCVDDKYYLNSNYAAKEKETLQNAKEVWLKGEHPRSLHILTFPAYCRYRALKKRLLSGMCFARAQLVALGGVIAEHRSSRVLFCRDSFHHPYLDKFELSGDNKAPVLKGRPRKKKRLAQNSVLKKKRFVADIQNHLVSSPAAKRCKLSEEEEEESTGSDMSEGVLERIKAPPQVGRKVQSSGIPPLVKPRVQVKIAVKAKTAEVPKVAAQDVSLSRAEIPKVPPPLIPSNIIKADVVRTSQPLQSSRKQVNVNTIECSRTTPIQKQIYSSNTKLRDIEKVNHNNNNNTVLLIKPRLTDRIQTKTTVAPVTRTVAPVTSPSPLLDSRTGKILNSLVENKKPSNPPSGTTVTYTHSVEGMRTIPPVQADVRLHTASSTRPVTTTQGTVGTQLATSTCPVVRNQPVASLQQQPVTSVQAVAPKSQQVVTPLVVSVSSSVNISDGVTSSGGGLPVRSKPSKENEERPPCVSEEIKENEIEQTEEAIMWKKKKRLRMPGSVKDEVYDDDDEKYFMQTLRDFMRKNNQPLGKLPALGFKKVNLWTMYTTAQRFGGYDAVTSKRLWRRVYDSLGGSTTITSAATYTRRHYERLLLPYEKYIRSQLKRQMDDKNPSTVNSLAQKEPLNKPEKKQGLTVSNSKTKPNLEPVKVKQNHGATGTTPARTNQDNTALPPLQALPYRMNTTTDTKVKQNQGATGTTPARTPQDNTALLSLQALPYRMNTTTDAKVNAVKTTDSGQAHSVAAPKASFKQGMSPVAARSIKKEYQESKTWSNKSKTSAAPSITSSTDKRNRAIPTEQFPQEVTATSQQNRNYGCIKVMRNDEETSARTNTVYAKNTAVVNTNLKQSVQAVPLQRVTRPVHDDTLVSPPPQHLNPVSKGREIIDLTSDDSPPRSQSKSHSVPHIQSSQGNAPEMFKVQRAVGGGDTEGRRHAQKSQMRHEYHDSSSRHHSIREVQPIGEMSPVYDMQTYNVQPFNNNIVPPQVQESSPGPTMKKGMDEVYAPLMQETVLPKYDKKRHQQQARVENLEGRYTHSPSDSVDEHFAEWLRRQSSVQHHHPNSNVSHHIQSTNPELGHLRYGYITDDICAPDCSCSLPTSRKDEIMSVTPLKPKKEHYEEELPFPGMALYPGRWSPSSMVADHPDLYISSHPAHLQAPPDALASHLCTASRIFIPTAQIFSPPYHLGVAPMGAPPLLTGTDDQLHIHPHCLMAPSYPCTSSSRTPDGTGYPLYSFT